MAAVVIINGVAWDVVAAYKTCELARKVAARMKLKYTRAPRSIRPWIVGGPKTREELPDVPDYFFR